MLKLYLLVTNSCVAANVRLHATRRVQIARIDVSDETFAYLEEALEMPLTFKCSVLGLQVTGPRKPEQSRRRPRLRHT